MSFKDYVETEKSQVKTLIDQYKNKIEALEQDLEDWEKKAEAGEPDHTSTTPAAVAADPNASSAERAAAANNTVNSNPEQVNAEQSYPTPSTHDSAKEESERRYAELHKGLDAEAQADDKDSDKELHEGVIDAGGAVVDAGTHDPEEKAPVVNAPKVTEADKSTEKSTVQKVAEKKDTSKGE